MFFFVDFLLLAFLLLRRVRADAENPDDDLWGDVPAASDLLRCGWCRGERAREREREGERAKEKERERERENVCVCERERERERDSRSERERERKRREFVWGGDVLAVSDLLRCGVG